MAFFLYLEFTDTQRSLLKYTKYYTYYIHGFLTNKQDEQLLNLACPLILISKYLIPILWLMHVSSKVETDWQ